MRTGKAVLRTWACRSALRRNAMSARVWTLPAAASGAMVVAAPRALAIGAPQADADLNSTTVAVPLSALRRLSESTSHAMRSLQAASQLAATQSQQFSAKSNIQMGSHMLLDEIIKNHAV